MNWLVVVVSDALIDTFYFATLKEAETMGLVLLGEFEGTDFDTAYLEKDDPNLSILIEEIPK